VGNIAGEIRHCSGYHDDVSTQICTKKGTSRSSQANFGYLSKMRHSAIRICTEEPDYSDIPRTEYDWELSVYRGAKEEIPKDALELLGKPVVTTTYVDANLYHCMLTGKSVCEVLVQQDSSRLVCEEARHIRDSYLWFRVR
jgi:hypothetical protein